jgi:hypothetical protein
MTANVIDIKPYVDFVHCKYKAIEEDEYIESHPQIKTLLPYLYKKQQEFIDVEVEKFMERVNKNEKCK